MLNVEQKLIEVATYGRVAEVSSLLWETPGCRCQLGKWTTLHHASVRGHDEVVTFFLIPLH